MSEPDRLQAELTEVREKADQMAAELHRFVAGERVSLDRMREALDAYIDQTGWQPGA